MISQKLYFAVHILGSSRTPEPGELKEDLTDRASLLVAIGNTSMMEAIVI